MISGQRLFKLLLIQRLQRTRRRIVGAVVPFQCVPVPFHAHTHTHTHTVTRDHPYQDMSPYWARRFSTFPIGFNIGTL